MEYGISTIKVQSSGASQAYLVTEYVNGLTSWSDVTDFLKNKLDQFTYRVNIYKYSSNDRLLGQKCVTMANLTDVMNSSNDKCLI